MELEHIKLLLVGTDKESQTLRTFPVLDPDLIRQAAIFAAGKVGTTNGVRNPVHCVTGNVTGQKDTVDFNDFLQAFGLKPDDLPKPVKQNGEVGTEPPAA